MPADFIDHSEETKKQKDEAVKKALVQIGLLMERNAKLHIEDEPRRVDTGRLRNSISNTTDGSSVVVVGTNVEYAPYVHEGTYRMEPNPFLRNAILEHIDEYKSIFEDALKD